jgi:N-terminal half of MaoC dehydratase
MNAPETWSEGHEVHVTVELIAGYAAAVGEEALAFSSGAPAPPMFAVVYAAPEVWQVVLAVVAGSGPLIHAAQELNWYAPVHAGDRILTRARLEQASVDGPHRMLRFASVSRNERAQLVSGGRWTILVPEGGL